jgi:hypothetical protein
VTAKGVAFGVIAEDSSKVLNDIIRFNNSSTA